MMCVKELFAGTTWSHVVNVLGNLVVYVRVQVSNQKICMIARASLCEAPMTVDHT